MHGRQARILCALLAGFFLVVGWWPFTPFPPNQVSWLSGRGGLSFARPGVVYDPQPLSVPAVPTANGSPAGFAIEVSLEAATEPDNSFPHIVTIHDGRTPSNLVIGQWHRELLVQVPTPRNRTRFHEDGIPGLEKGQRRVVTISSDASATTFYMDGRLVRRVPGFALGPESLRGQLILGNAATGKRSWTGTLFGLAIFSRTLSAREIATHHTMWTGGTALQLARQPGLVALYNFADASGQEIQDHSPSQHRLIVPSRYMVLEKTVLGPGSAQPRTLSATGDIAVNLLGFVPFGFLAFASCRVARRRSLLLPAILATLAGAGLSLLIEVVQVWLPTRDSSVLDLICNTAGTIVGVVLACWKAAVSLPRH